MLLRVLNNPDVYPKAELGKFGIIWMFKNPKSQMN